MFGVYSVDRFGTWANIGPTEDPLLEDHMLELFGAFGGLIALILAVLAVLLPLSAYSAQKYAYKCHKHLEETNRLLQELVELNSSGPSRVPPVEAPLKP